MKTMYKTEVWRHSGNSKIEPVEVVKETAKTVTILKRAQDFITGKEKTWEDREHKTTDYHQYHATWEDAHSYLLADADKRVDAARRELERLKGAQGNIKGMKKPANETDSISR